MEDPITPLQQSRLEQAARDLAKHGYAVIEGVLSPDACEATVSDVWRSIASLTSKWAEPIAHDKPATHRGTKFLPAMKGIIMAPPALSHCGAAWTARKAAAPYFARLHGTANLVASFDRINMMPAPCETCKPMQIKNWLHSDQTPLLKGLHSIQGYIDFKGTGPLDGGLVVADGSHLQHHALLFGEWGIDTADNWIPFFGDKAPANALDTIKQRFVMHKVECTPGSLVLWDSRTFHQNEPPKMGGHERVVIYTSFQPLSAVPAAKLGAILAKRVDIFKARRATSHIALSHVKQFGEKPRSYGRDLPTYHVDDAAIGVPNLANDPVVASLVGASRAPFVIWPCGRAPLLHEALIAPELMVAARPVLLKALGVTAAKKRKRAVSDDDDDQRPRAYARRDESTTF